MPASKFMRHPELNRQVAIDALEDLDGSYRLRYTSGLPQSNRRGHTYVVGSFTCANASCRKSWASGRVYVEIYFTPPNSLTQDHQFDVIMWKQQCRKCKKISEPKVDEAIYKERIASKLQLFMGARAAIIPSKDEKKTKPHRKDLCCACMEGKCGEGGGRE